MSSGVEDLRQLINAICLEVAVYNSIAEEPCVRIEMSPFLYRRLQQAMHAESVTVAQVPVQPVNELAEVETEWAWRVSGADDRPKHQAQLSDAYPDLTEEEAWEIADAFGFAPVDSSP